MSCAGLFFQCQAHLLASCLGLHLCLTDDSVVTVASVRGFHVFSHPGPDVPVKMLRWVYAEALDRCPKKAEVEEGRHPLRPFSIEEMTLPAVLETLAEEFYQWFGRDGPTRLFFHEVIALDVLFHT